MLISLTIPGQSTYIYICTRCMCVCYIYRWDEEQPAFAYAAGGLLRVAHQGDLLVASRIGAAGRGGGGGGGGKLWGVAKGAQCYPP